MSRRATELTAAASRKRLERLAPSVEAFEGTLADLEQAKARIEVVEARVAVAAAALVAVTNILSAVTSPNVASIAKAASSTATLVASPRPWIVVSMALACVKHHLFVEVMVWVPCSEHRAQSHPPVISGFVRAVEDEGLERVETVLFQPLLREGTALNLFFKVRWSLGVVEQGEGRPWFVPLLKKALTERSGKCVPRGALGDLAEGKPRPSDGPPKVTIMRKMGTPRELHGFHAAHGVGGVAVRQRLNRLAPPPFGKPCCGIGPRVPRVLTRRDRLELSTPPGV